jgi:hypothetical protein
MEQLVKERNESSVYSAKSGSVTIHLDIDKMILTVKIKINWLIINIEKEKHFDLSNIFKKERF